MSETEIGCVLAGAAALGAVLVLNSRSKTGVFKPERGGKCASAMRATTTYPDAPFSAGQNCTPEPAVSAFNQPTLFPPPRLQTKNLNAIQGMRAQRRTLTEMVAQQLDASRHNKLSGYQVLSVGRCQDDESQKPSCQTVQQMMMFNSPLDGHTSCP